MTHLKAFFAGFISTLVFHQGVLWVLVHNNPNAPRHPWDMSPVPPLGVPSVISLAFWAGLWGILLWQLIRASRGGMYWTRAGVLGALLPTLVSMFVVSPLKGLPLAFGWNPIIIVGALIVNAAWGLGTALLMRAMNRAMP